MDSSTLALVAGVVAVVALLVALVAVLRAGAIHRQLLALGADGDHDVVSLLAREHDRVSRLGSDLTALSTRIDSLDGQAAAGLRHVAVVRYDAFGDMGGRLSFSAALVDDTGDGLVLSSIHARGESRTYAKGVVGGVSEITLSPEERQALTAARDSSKDRTHE
ncbi:DUF4446 family protein [Demetria terragena]|uniref:DUF4446 family protein n=1 Tax=Demetria terragena TaxID=63959 RepID=UPI001FDEEF34|nr:DUF4446 family protein [Demetria terragena]